MSVTTFEQRLTPAVCLPPAYPEQPSQADGSITASEQTIALNGFTMGCRRIDGICRSKAACKVAKECLDPDGL